mgnify:CR=1 FL=1
MQSIQNAILNKIVNKAPTNTHVAPVNAPFFSFSLNIKSKYREKIIDAESLFFLEISTKKQNIKKKIQSQNIQSVPNVYTHIFIAIEVQLQHRQQPRAFSITSAFSVM